MIEEGRRKYHKFGLCIKKFGGIFDWQYGMNKSTSYFITFILNAL